MLFGDARPFVANAALAPAIGMLRTFRTQAHHLRVAADAGLLTAEQVPAFGACVEELRRHGAIDTWAELARRVRPADVRTSRIVDLVIVTRDRPQLATRAIRSYATNARAFGRDLGVRLFIDNADRGVVRSYLELAQDAARALGIPVRYCDRDARALAAERIATSTGAPVEALRHAMLGDASAPTTRGANTNSALLEMVGRTFLATDDDVVCALRGPSSGAPSMTLTPDPWPVRTTHYPSMQELHAAHAELAVDYVATHERWLGKSLGQLFSAEVAPGEQTDLFAVSAMNAETRIAATCGSFYGDSGSQFPCGLLFASDEQFQRGAMYSEGAYREAVESRTVWRGVSGVTIGPTEAIQAIALGIDVDTSPAKLTPPFFSSFRCSDNLFGAMIRMATPGAWFAYVPEAVGHHPAPPRRDVRDQLWTTAAAVRWYEATLALLSLYGSNADGCTSESWLLGLAEFLRRAATLPPGDVEDLLVDALALSMAQQVSVLEEHIRRWEGRPAHWASDARAHCDALLAWVAGGHLELWEPDLRRGGLPRLQELWRESAAVLEVWPAVLRHCSDAAEEFTVPLR
jgi:hypothetical protein